MAWPKEAFLHLRQILTPGSRPATGGNLLYVKADNELYLMDADGTEHAVGGAGGGSGVVETIVAGGQISVDSTDPANPIVATTGLVESVGAGTNVSVDSTDPANPVVSASFTETLPESIIDAKGDLILGTAADTASRLAVGADATSLVADSAQATGVKWENRVKTVVAGDNVTVDSSDPLNPVVASTPPAYRGCAALRTTTQSSITSAGVAVQFDAADQWDTDSIHDPSSNNTRFTIPTGLDGFWNFTATVNFASISASRRVNWAVNGTQLGTEYAQQVNTGASVLYETTTVDLQLAAGDYVEVIALSSSTTSISAARATCRYLGA